MPRRSGHAKKIETVHWTRGSWSVNLAAGTTAVEVLAAQHLPETLMRMRGQNLTYFDGAGTFGQLAAVACGLILVPEGTGTTVLWSPITDGDAPWIWYDEGAVGHEEPVVDVIGVPIVTGFRTIIDNKAMRRIRNLELQFVAENATLQNAATVNIAGHVRVLAGS